MTMMMMMTMIMYVWMWMWMMTVAEVYKIDPHTSVGASRDGFSVLHSLSVRQSDSPSVIQTVAQLDKASYGLHCDEC